MNRHIPLVILAALVSVSALAQTELTMKKFRFRKHSAADFERLVLEFSGPSVEQEVEVKETMAGSERDVSLNVKNAQLVGAIPESALNESLRDNRKWMGPLSFNTDVPKNGFSLRTLLKNSEAQVDAFWLANPTRLVVDVYPKKSPRANSRNLLDSTRKVASHGKSHKVENKKQKSEGKQAEPIFCFPANAKMSAAVAYSPWKGSNSVPMDVKDPATAQNEMKEGIVCYPSQSRVHPQVSFTTGEVEQAQPVALAPHEAASEKPAAPSLPSGEMGLGANASPLLPPMEPKAAAPRTIANEAEAMPQFNPSVRGGLPPSLGANFEKAQKGANPASLLPPYR